MKHLVLVALLIMLISSNIFSQQYQRDTRIQILKEDDNNLYKSDQITDIDLLQALELSGIAINKFQIGSFDKKYNLLILVDEYKDNKNVKLDTLYYGTNEYIYFLEGEKDYFTDYIDQIKIISKIQDTVLTFQFITYGVRFKKEIHYRKCDKESFYNFRTYSNTRWEHNVKIPLLAYASSWKDKKYGFQRFCGVVDLSSNIEKTNELLTSSPHYYLISYLIQEIKD